MENRTSFTTSEDRTQATARTGRLGRWGRPHGKAAADGASRSEGCYSGFDISPLSPLLSLPKYVGHELFQIALSGFKLRPLFVHFIAQLPAIHSSVLSLTARLLCAAFLCARHGFRAAPHIDARTIAPRHLGIDEAGNQDAAVECYDLTIARTASGLLAGADVVLAVRSTLEAEFGRLGLIGEMHDDAAAGTAADVVWLLALAARCGFGARAVFFLVIGGKPPPSNKILRWNAGRECRRRHRGRLWRRPCGAASEKECPDDGGCTRGKRSRYLAASISVVRHLPILSAMILTEADAVCVRCA